MEIATTEAAPLPKYHAVNSQWQAGTNEGRTVKPTPKEAMAGAKRLYRVAMGKPWRGRVEITSGRRHTSIRSGVLYVNPDQTWDGGWHGIVHSISHHASWRLYRENHGPRHAFIEKELIAYAVRSGFLDGKLRRPVKEKPAADPKAARHASVLARIEAWERKMKRAETALRKLARQRAYYERQQAA